eukprot:snap_masked-scaffold_6-processed-gene-7.25-mRNA-1 protein AED:0.10 eAED:0.10 QI:0/-1/0/1/-1/1/1/0/271
MKDGKCSVDLSNRIVQGANTHQLSSITGTIYSPLTKDLEEDQSKKLINIKSFQKIVGLLNYIALHTRPDISYAVQSLSSKLKEPTQDALAQAKRTLSYLLQYHSKTMIYDKIKEKENILFLLTDSSFANSVSRKSVYGNLILLNDNIISYRSKLEPVITFSSTEAEFVAISISIQDLKGKFNILKDLNIDFKVVVLVDSQPAIRLCLGRIAVGRLKHLDTKFKYVSQEISTMKAVIHHIPTYENWADIFTKRSTRTMLKKFRDKFYEESTN